jgi:hypothetical protein
LAVGFFGLPKTKVYTVEVNDQANDPRDQIIIMNNAKELHTKAPNTIRDPSTGIRS